jgi:ariadne-1
MSDGYEEPEYEEFEEEDNDYNEDPTGINNSFSRSCSLQPTLLKKGSTLFVTIEDIKQLITQKCKDICELLGTNSDEAIIIYNHFRWRKDLVEGEYFGDEEKNRKKAGLEPETKAPDVAGDNLTCNLCFDEKPREDFEALKCNHNLCKDCWREYIEYNVERPENFFFWKCPMEGCNMIVPNSFNLKYIANKEQEYLFYKKMAVAYADNSKSLRWCPAADCEYGAEVESVGVKCIECPCGWMYCFRCGLEDHRPCDCPLAQEWTKKDEAGGANAKWLLVNTKDCMKCKRPIEKNQGCNYMRCRHPGCQYEFCWLCLGDWKTHNDHFKCNKFDNLSKEEKDKMTNSEQDKRQELQKYVFYYERYMNNNMAIESANKIMRNLKKEQKEIAINLSLTLTQLEFLENGCQVLRNAKRTLKWSYAYGFYLSNDLQRNLYEIIQEKMDMYSSELHVLMEKDYETAKTNIGDFTKFKDKVLSAMFKCRQSCDAFLEKMEEFETMMIEEELNNMKKEAEKNAKIKKRGSSKRQESMVSNASEIELEGPAKKATKKGGAKGKK